MLRMGSSVEPHGLFRGHRAGLTPGHDDLPPAPQVEVEQSKHISLYLALPRWRYGRFPDDPSAQLPLRTPSPPSARPALAEEGCGDGPVTLKSSDLRRMLLGLIRACDYPRDPDGYAGVVVYLLRLAREWRIAGDASGADRVTSDIEDIMIHYNLLADSDRAELLQRLRAFQSAASLPFCPACEAECSKVESFKDLRRLIYRDCPCRPSPVSTASEAATAVWAPADRACCPGISGGVLPRAEVASVDAPATRSDHFATDVAEHLCVALPDGPDILSAAESACPPAAATAESSSHWSRERVIHLLQLGCLLRMVPRRNSKISDSCRPDTTTVLTALDAPIASRQEAALMPSAALTLPGNADGDARVNDDSICDPLQGSLTIGEVTPVIFRGDLKALAPEEAIYAFYNTADQRALLAAPDAQPISLTDSLAVGPLRSAEIDQALVSFIIIAAHCVALPVKDGAAVAVYLSGCDPPAVYCF